MLNNNMTQGFGVKNVGPSNISCFWFVSFLALAIAVSFVFSPEKGRRDEVQSVEHSILN